MGATPALSRRCARLHDPAHRNHITAGRDTDEHQWESLAEKFKSFKLNCSPFLDLFVCMSIFENEYQINSERPLTTEFPYVQKFLGGPWVFLTSKKIKKWKTEKTDQTPAVNPHTKLSD